MVLGLPHSSNERLADVSTASFCRSLYNDCDLRNAGDGMIELKAQLQVATTRFYTRSGQEPPSLKRTGLQAETTELNGGLPAASTAFDPQNRPAATFPPPRSPLPRPPPRAILSLPHALGTAPHSPEQRSRSCRASFVAALKLALAPPCCLRHGRLDIVLAQALTISKRRRTTEAEASW